MNAAVPNLNASSKSRARGRARVLIASRVDAQHTGTFTVELGVQFDPAVDAYPTGNLHLLTDLSDSLKGAFNATLIDVMNSYGKHNPTIVFTGRLRVDPVQSVEVVPEGLRFWILISDNKQRSLPPPIDRGTPDVISFLITDRDGNRVAYGTGPVASGDIQVAQQ